MKKQPKISEILHLAADKYLWDGSSGFFHPNGRYWTEEYTCNAVGAAIQDLNAWYMESATFGGLVNMGVNTGSSFEFKEYKDDPQRQSARYNWLKFAAMIAEEQGV
jgi:hypothetical protein